MSADLLRRAAAKLRETAEAATPGPWSVDGDIQAVKAAGGTTIAYDDETEMSDGQFIALMHPPVALALADLLERRALQIADAMRGWARDTSYIDKFLGGVDGLARESFAAEFALASAILREPEEGNRG